MSYISAEEILPREILASVQQYCELTLRMSKKVRSEKR